MSDDDSGPADDVAVPTGVIEPPTDTAGEPPHEPRTSRTLALVALALSVVAGVSCLLLLVPAWNSPIGVSVTVVLALAAVLCAIVALERGRKTATAVCAVVVASVVGVVATAGALPQPDLAIHVYGYKDCLFPTSTHPAGINYESYVTAFYAPALVGQETSMAQLMPAGTAVAVAGSPLEGSVELATITAGAAIDVTHAAASPPLNGAYLAVPITIEAVNEGAFDCYGFTAPVSYWVDTAGGLTDYITVSIPGYPTIEAGGVDNGDGTYTYYDIFDVDPTEVANGVYEMDLLEPDGTVQSLFWAGTGR